jgi:hypothetical protein
MKWLTESTKYFSPTGGNAETATLQDEAGNAVLTLSRTAAGTNALKLGNDIGTPAAGVTCVQTVVGGFVTLDFTFLSFGVTLVKNGTSTGGGGTSFFTFNNGLVSPCGGSSDLTVLGQGDKSFLASVGSAAAATDGTLTSTEISFLPSTAATTSSNVGTCKMKATSTTPTPGARLDGSSTAIQCYLNSALNSNATGVEQLYYTGTLRLICIFDGDN